MLRYLLDTNVLSSMVRQPQGDVAAKVVSVGQDRVSTSIVVAAEVRYGARKSGSKTLRDRIAMLLSAIDETYVRVRHDLGRRGALIGQLALKRLFP